MSPCDPERIQASRSIVRPLSNYDCEVQLRAGWEPTRLTNRPVRPTDASLVKKRERVAKAARLVCPSPARFESAVEIAGLFPVQFPRSASLCLFRRPLLVVEVRAGGV